MSKYPMKAVAYVCVTGNTQKKGMPVTVLLEFQYWDVVDLIEFPGESGSLWIRIGYYRKAKNRLNWPARLGFEKLD